MVFCIMQVTVRIMTPPPCFVEWHISSRGIYLRLYNRFYRAGQNLSDRNFLNSLKSSCTSLLCFNCAFQLLMTKITFLQLLVLKIIYIYSYFVFCHTITINWLYGNDSNEYKLSSALLSSWTLFFFFPILHDFWISVERFLASLMGSHSSTNCIRLQGWP